MPRYDFKNIPTKISFKPKQRPDITLKLDDKNYLNESINTRFIKKIEYSCPLGSISVQGLFDLSKVDLENLVSFKNLTLSFSPEIKSAYKQEFDTPKISINFKLIEENEEMIKKNIYELKRIYKDLDTDYKSYLKFSIEEFNDINIMEMMNKIDEEEKNELKELNIKNESKKFLEINDNIDDDNLEQEENINNKSDVFNFFPLNFNDKEKEEQKEIDKEENIKKNKYIKIKDIDKFIIENQNLNLAKSKIIKKYLLNSKNKKIKEEIIKDYLIPINFNNSLFSIETNKDKIEFKNVLINDELKQLNEIYKNDIILDFLNLLIEKGNNIKEKNLMSINDYTSIIVTFIKNIEKKISEIKKNNMKDKEYKYYIHRLGKVNSSLKLFHILFLNCFYSSNDNNNEYLYDNYSSLKVQTMRKKLLIEWCMSEENNYINKLDLININKNKRREILTKQIMSFGQIKTAIKSNKNNNFFINSKLSNLSEKETNKTLNYLIKNQSRKNELNKIFISYKANEPVSDKIKNSWISYFLQSLLYKEKSNEYIIKSINLIEEKIKDMDDNSKPYVKGVFEINFVLLKLYEKLINGIKDINELNELLNMLSNNNLFSKNNSDHFFQYIISYLLMNIIPYIFPDIKENELLKKINYFLLNTIISEILYSDLNNEKKEENEINNLILIIKLLFTSNINNNLKQKKFVDIISRHNLNNIDSFWEKYEKEKLPLLNELNKEYINGIYYLNKNNLLMSYKSFVKAKKYRIAIDIYIKYFFSLIREKNFNKINFQEIFNNLKEIYEKAPSLFNDFYLYFSLYIKYKVNKDESDYKKIVDLLRKFIFEYSENNNIIYLDEEGLRFIINSLCELLIEKKEKNENLILCGELRINELEIILFEEKANLFNNIFKDSIKRKNQQFHKFEKI